jgi:hypothetical protein
MIGLSKRPGGTSLKSLLVLGLVLLLPLLFATSVLACTLDNWNGGVTGSVGTNGKAFEGSCGAKFQIGDQNLITDLSPADETTYVASFYAFLGEMDLEADGQLIIFSANQGTDDPEVRLRIDRIGDGHYIVLEAFQDSLASVETSPVQVNYGWNQVQLRWAAATTPGGNDGFAALKLDDTEAGLVENLQNGSGAINEAQLGRVDDAVTTSDRFFDADLFDSRRVDDWIPATYPFDDVAIFNAEIGDLYNTGITSGCGVRQYCPSAQILRAQMAIFMLRAMLGSYHSPPPLGPGGSSFSDVGLYDTWIEEFYQTGITSGCATNPLRFCPGDPVSRAQMAIFILRALEGPSYQPPPLPPSGSSFNDVTLYADWIEELANRGITLGCGGGNYCPANPVTRGQMALFIHRAWGLPISASQATISN